MDEKIPEFNRMVQEKKIPEVNLKMEAIKKLLIALRSFSAGGSLIRWLWRRKTPVVNLKK